MKYLGQMVLDFEKKASEVVLKKPSTKPSLSVKRVTPLSISTLMGRISNASIKALLKSMQCPGPMLFAMQPIVSFAQFAC